MRTSLILALVLCIATSAFATNSQTPAPVSQIPAIPKSIPGGTYFNTAAIKKNTIVLQTYLTQTANFIINAVNRRSFAPASYGVIVRGAFRENIYNGKTVTGYKITYYVKAHEPGNDKGKDYYAHYITTVNVNGSNKKYVTFVLDAALAHGTK